MLAAAVAETALEEEVVGTAPLLLALPADAADAAAVHGSCVGCMQVVTVRKA